MLMYLRIENKNLFHNFTEMKPFFKSDCIIIHVIVQIDSNIDIYNRENYSVVI